MGGGLAGDIDPFCPAVGAEIVAPQDCVGLAGDGGEGKSRNAAPLR